LYRILHVIDSLGYGGTELQLALNVSGMKADRFENYVCYLHGPNHLEPVLDRSGIPVFSLGLTGKRQWLRGVLRLRRLVRSLNIDLIHTNLFEADVIGGITGRLTKRPVISTIANVCFEPEFLVDNPRLSRVKLAVPRYIRSAVAHACNTHLISVSQAVAQSAIHQLRIPAQKTSIIHRALSGQWLEPPDEGYLRSLRAELGLAEAWPVLLNVGRLIPQKGQCYVIVGMKEVVEAFPKARLLIASDGYLKPRLMELRDRLGLTDQVTFLGRRDDIKAFHAVSDIFVFPSLRRMSQCLD
jgi:glycosyltransferase involved in cell wall biosynthesis